MPELPIADDPLRGSRRFLRRVTGRRGPDHLPGEAPCRILVGGASGLDALGSTLAGVLGAPVGAEPGFEHEGLRVTLGQNQDAGSGDAGRWSHAVELVPVEPVPHDRYVEIASSILQALWSNGLRAVAFCSFGHDLPSQSRPTVRRV
jgi:hypothetical protein